MIFPTTISLLPNQIVVTKCTVNGVGKTDIELTYCGQAFKPFTLDQNVDVVGFDALIGPIQEVASNQICDALSYVG